MHVVLATQYLPTGARTLHATGSAVLIVMSSQTQTHGNDVYIAI